MLGVITVPDPDKNYPTVVSIKATDPPGFTTAFNLALVQPCLDPFTAVEACSKWALTATKGSEFDYETIIHSSGEHKVGLFVDAVDSGRGASASFHNTHIGLYILSSSI